MDKIFNFSGLDSQIQDEIDEKRRVAIEKANDKKTRLLAVPEYRELEKIEKEITLMLSKNNDKSLATTLKNVNNAKKEMLKKLNIKESEFQPKFECKICGDTGRVKEGRCKCFMEKRNKLLINLLGLDESFLAGFANFDTSLCKDEKQRAELEKLSKFLDTWADKFPDVKKRNIVICGPTGVGKTYSSKCLAGKLISAGKNVCFLSAFELNNLMMKYHTTFDSSKNSYLSAVLSADVLFVDDLGTEPMTKNVTENYLTLVLSERELAGRATIVTTNLTPNDILDRYHERVYSRLMSKRVGQVFHLDGSDLRISK